jgi:acyl-CoA reductase-like NAD-dependent aldehyde dehydrogenase
MLTQANPYPFASQQLPCLIDGEFVLEGRTFTNVSPVNGEVLATVTEAAPALVDRAVQAARAALGDCRPPSAVRSCARSPSASSNASTSS